jgi:regulator of cell morphogenesis and NO signaling
MNINNETIIGSLVAEDYRTAQIFKKNKIDFCCNGNRTIAQACEQKSIDSNALVEELNNLPTNQGDNSIDFNTWPLDLLADYIIKKHHRYVNAQIVDILPFLRKVARVHGERHPELLEIESLFNASAIELTSHMQKEESILFPYIQKLVLAKEQNATIQPPFGTVKNPVNMMMNEHDTEGERFRKIATLTNNYTPPEDACNTYKVTFALLKAFEEDLHLHIHLENNILFPKAIKMEESQEHLQSYKTINF